MIQLVPQLKVLVACEPVDFRKGIDSLACVCRQQFQLDPFLGTLFVFRNRSGTALKLLVYDGQGFWLCQSKRPLPPCSRYVASEASFVCSPLEAGDEGGKRCGSEGQRGYRK